MLWYECLHLQLIPTGGTVPAESSGRRQSSRQRPAATSGQLPARQARCETFNSLRFLSFRLLNLQVWRMSSSARVGDTDIVLPSGTASAQSEHLVLTQQHLVQALRRRSAERPGIAAEVRGRGPRHRATAPATAGGKRAHMDGAARGAGSCRGRGGSRRQDRGAAGEASV